MVQLQEILNEIIQLVENNQVEEAKAKSSGFKLYKLDSLKALGEIQVAHLFLSQGITRAQTKIDNPNSYDKDKILTDLRNAQTKVSEIQEIIKKLADKGNL